METSLGFPIFL